MGFSYQLNALTDEELAKDAKEEFGETKNLLEVLSLVYGNNKDCIIVFRLQ